MILTTLRSKHRIVLLSCVCILSFSNSNCQDRKFIDNSRIVAGFDILEYDERDPDFGKQVANSFQIGLEYAFKPSWFRAKFLFVNKYYDTRTEDLHLIYALFPVSFAIPTFHKRLVWEAGIFGGFKIADNWPGRMPAYEVGFHLSVEYYVKKGGRTSVYFSFMKGHADLSSHPPYWTTYQGHGPYAYPVEFYNHWFSTGCKFPLFFVKKKPTEGS